MVPYRFPKDQRAAFDAAPVLPFTEATENHQRPFRSEIDEGSVFANDGRFAAFDRAGGFRQILGSVIIVIIKFSDEAVLGQIDGIVQAFAKLVFLGELKHSDFILGVLACTLPIELDIHAVVIQDDDHVLVLPKLPLVILEYVVHA